MEKTHRIEIDMQSILIVPDVHWISGMTQQTIQQQQESLIMHGDVFVVLESIQRYEMMTFIQI
jgi:hypothetical protein